MASDVEKKWRTKNIIAFWSLLVAMGEHFARDVVVSSTGMSPVQWAVGLSGGKFAANAAAYYLYSGDQAKMNHWFEAETTMYGWYGAEYTWLGAPLNFIPNPIGIVEIVGRSGAKILDHISAPLIVGQHGSFTRARDYYEKHGTLSGSRIHSR